MSGIAKGVKKVFKKVVKVIKEIAKPVLIAAAVYFTAGLALSAMPATAGFAASMPGFAGGGFLGTGIGGTAGTGIFSQAASAIGLGGGLTAGAMGAGTTAGELLTAGISSKSVLGATLATGGAPETAAALGTTFGAGGAATVGGGAISASQAGLSTGLSKAPASLGLSKMSLTDKLLLTKVGTDVAGALFGPTPQEEFEAEAIERAKFRGAYYGMEAGGVPFEPPAEPQAPNVVPPQAAPNTISPEQQSLLAGRGIKEDRFPGGTKPQVGTTTGPGAMQSNIPIPEGLFSAAPNVRYV